MNKVLTGMYGTQRINTNGNDYELVLQIVSEYVQYLRENDIRSMEGLTPDAMLTMAVVGLKHKLFPVPFRYKDINMDIVIIDDLNSNKTLMLLGANVSCVVFANGSENQERAAYIQKRMMSRFRDNGFLTVYLNPNNT